MGRGRPLQVDQWADDVLDCLIDEEKHNITALMKYASLNSNQVHRAIQYLRKSGIAVLEHRGNYWLSLGSLEQLVYSFKRLKDISTRALTSLGSLERQDRHFDQRYLNPHRRRLRFMAEESADALSYLEQEIAKRRSA